MDDLLVKGLPKNDLPELIQLVDQEMRMGSDQSVFTDYPLVYREDNLENIRVIKVENRIASVVPYIPQKVVIQGSRFSIGIISPTVTSPNHRKKGYASKCLQDCINRMNKNDIDLSVLWTKAATFPFYEKAGYQGVRNQDYIYKCEKSDACKFAQYGEEIVEYNPQNQKFLENIQQMHEKEATLVARNADAYTYLFNLPKMKTWLAILNNKVTAYLLISHAVNKPGLIEGGGDEKSLETLINYALISLDDNAYYSGYSYRTETVLGNLLRKKLSDKQKVMTQGGMMIRINNIGSFVRKSRQWLETKNSRKECSFSIYVHDTEECLSFRMSNGKLSIGNERMADHFEMSRRTLTSAFFGQYFENAIDIPDLIKAFFTLDFSIWMLDRS